MAITANIKTYPNIGGSVEPETIVIVKKEIGLTRRYVLKSIGDESPNSTCRCGAAPVRQNGTLNGEVMITINLNEWEVMKAGQTCKFN